MDNATQQKLMQSCTSYQLPKIALIFLCSYVIRVKLTLCAWCLSSGTRELTRKLVSTYPAHLLMIWQGKEHARKHHWMEEPWFPNLETRMGGGDILRKNMFVFFGSNRISLCYNAPLQGNVFFIQPNFNVSKQALNSNCWSVQVAHYVNFESLDLFEKSPREIFWKGR